MNWKALVLRYAWRIAVGEALRSKRWPDEQKTVAIVGLGLVIGVAVIVSWIAWLATGRGPVRSLLASGGFVEPFRMPAGALTVPRSASEAPR